VVSLFVLKGRGANRSTKPARVTTIFMFFEFFLRVRFHSRPMTTMDTNFLRVFAKLFEALEFYSCCFVLIRGFLRSL